MGWFYPNTTNTKKELVNYLVKAYTLIDHSLRGNVLYGLCQINLNVTDDFGNVVKVEKDRVIVVFLLNSYDKEWGYKSIEETCGPCEYDCPKRILEKSTIPDDSKWRSNCFYFLEKYNIQLVENAWYMFSIPYNNETKWQYKRLKRNWKKDQMYWKSEGGQEYRITNVITRYNPKLITV